MKNSFSYRIKHMTYGTFILLLLVLPARMVYFSVVKHQALRPVVFDLQSVSEDYMTKPKCQEEEAQEEEAQEEEVQEECQEGPVEFADLPGPVRVRTSKVLLTKIERGSICDRNGKPFAYDKWDEGQLIRVYEEPFAPHVVGYVSAVGLPISGIEYHSQATLLGQVGLENWVKRLLQMPIQGNDVCLTIDADIQQVATAAFDKRNATGAIVVMDSETGEILAMVSAPGFDPNVRVGTAELNDYPICSIKLFNKKLFKNNELPCKPDESEWNRATLGGYAPGSIWKTIILIAALETGLVTPEEVFHFDESHNGCYGEWVDGKFIPDCNHFAEELSLEESYIVSSNTTFVRLALEMGHETLQKYAMAFGFGFGFGDEVGRAPIEKFPLPVNAPQLADNEEALQNNKLLLAETGIGQGQLQTSPLSMALVLSAVLNDGDIPTPHLLKEIRHPSGEVLEEKKPPHWKTDIMSRETARLVREMMIQVVEHELGTGRLAKVGVPEGITVGGKTGTAQVDGDDDPHAWFTGFAEKGERSIVIAVIVENGGEGGQVAAPIFAEVAKAAEQYLSEASN